MRKSKTDQLGKGSWLRLGAVGGTLCPVAMVTEFLKVSPVGKIFFGACVWGPPPFTRHQFSAVFKRCLVAAGFSASDFGTHSFRIGAATEAARAGLGWVTFKELVGGSRGAMQAMFARNCCYNVFSPFSGPSAPVVHILGHSYIHRAAQRAICRPGGRSLGFPVQVHWRGIGGLPWSRILMEAIQIGGVSRTPVVLVIHAGGNDIRSLRVPEIITLMRMDLERMVFLFSEMMLVWSEIIPRVTWQEDKDAAAIERARRTINARMSRYVRARSGVVVRHRQLEGDNRRLMGQDGVHLNDIGLDIFCLVFRTV